MEIILAIAIATMATSHSLKNTIVDGWYGLKGRPSPRMVRAAKRRDSRANRQRGAFGQYMSELWRDSWSDAHDKRIRRRNERLSREPWPRGAFRSYLRAVGNDWWARWEDAWDQRAEKRRSTPAPEFIDASVSEDWKRQDDGTVSARMRCPECGRLGPHTGEFDGDVDYPTHLRCTNCGRTALYDMNPDDEPTPGRETQPAPEPEPAWHVVTTPDGGQFVTTTDPTLHRDLGHRVRPLHPEPDQPVEPNTTEGNTMTTTQTGEVTGLTSSINFAAGTAAAFDAAVTAIEQTAAALAANDVGEGILQLLGVAQEQAASAAATMRNVESGLASMRSVEEAYHANPDAGDKQFVLSE